MKSAIFFNVAIYLACTAPAMASKTVCANGAEPHLVITTGQGPMVARLLETAAPRTVRRLANLVEGPVFHPEILADAQDMPAVGYYDGLAFNYTQAHVEIVTDVRPPGDLIRIDTELDAGALGLDRERIENSGKAMDLAQHELSPAYKRVLKSGRVHPQLKAWMEKLYGTHDASFLVGVSRQEINEAMGYTYQDGLDSQPVTRGALMLKPLSPRVASARLSIALADMPQRTGRWMVVGRIVEGLETAQEISVRQLADPAFVRSRNQPANPVRIESIRLDCRNPR